MSQLYKCEYYIIIYVIIGNNKIYRELFETFESQSILQSTLVTLSYT